MGRLEAPGLVREGGWGAWGPVVKPLGLDFVYIQLYCVQHRLDLESCMYEYVTTSLSCGICAFDSHRAFPFAYQRGTAQRAVS